MSSQGGLKFAWAQIRARGQNHVKTTIDTSYIEDPRLVFQAKNPSFLKWCPKPTNLRYCVKLQACKGAIMLTGHISMSLPPASC